MAFDSSNIKTGGAGARNQRLKQCNFVNCPSYFDQDCGHAVKGFIKIIGMAFKGGFLDIVRKAFGVKPLITTVFNYFRLKPTNHFFHRSNDKTIIITKTGLKYSGF